MTGQTEVSGTAETEAPNEITVLWDKVLKAVYQDEPRADATADEDGDYTTEAFVRDDNEAKIAKAIKKAWKASRKLPLSDLPDISKQGDWTGSYYQAVEDAQALEFEDDDDVQEMLEEVLEFLTEWSEHCESR